MITMTPEPGTEDPPIVRVYDCDEPVGSIVFVRRIPDERWNWSILVSGPHNSGFAAAREEAERACMEAWAEARAAMGNAGWIAYVQHHAQVRWRQWEWEVRRGGWVQDAQGGG